MHLTENVFTSFRLSSIKAPLRSQMSPIVVERHKSDLIGLYNTCLNIISTMETSCRFLFSFQK